MKARILLVDDEKNILHALRRRLGNHFAITMTTSGQEALTILQKEGPFAIIISDYKMPGLDGIDLLSQAKEIAPYTVRIMLTGYPPKTIEPQSLKKIQVFEFLMKPCSAQEIFEVIKRGLEHHNLMQKENGKTKSLLHLLKDLGGIHGNEREIGQEIEQILGISLEILLDLATHIQRIDPYTAMHQEKVAHLAGLLANKMGLLSKEVDELILAGYFHDIGNSLLPTNILLKADLLKQEEKIQIKEHVERGYEILKERGFPHHITRLVLEHHERLDGSGYPKGLRGKEISLGGKILGVADVVEAMASWRPYRKAFHISTIRGELETNKGTLYDSQVVLFCQEILSEREGKHL